MELCAFKRNNFILYKLIPCLIITMFAIMCLYGSRVYASDNSYYTRVPYNFNDTEKYLTLDNSFNDYKYVFAYIATDSKTYTLKIVASNTSPLRFDYNHYNDLQLICDGDVHSLNASGSDISRISNGLTLAINDLTENQRWVNIHTETDKNHFYYFSNYDILDNNGNVVFQAPPQVQETQAIIAEQVGEVEMNKTLQEILGILPVVIVVLVGLIAIRKGIQFLMARMKKA